MTLGPRCCVRPPFDGLGVLDFCASRHSNVSAPVRLIIRSNVGILQLGPVSANRSPGFFCVDEAGCDAPPVVARRTRITIRGVRSRQIIGASPFLPHLPRCSRRRGFLFVEGNGAVGTRASGVNAQGYDVACQQHDRAISALSGGRLLGYVNNRMVVFPPRFIREVAI